jgi:hypothetical protein
MLGTNSKAQSVDPTLVVKLHIWFQLSFFGTHPASKDRQGSTRSTSTGNPFFRRVVLNIESHTHGCRHGQIGIKFAGGLS